jgi:hypothetical protein
MAGTNIDEIRDGIGGWGLIDAEWSEHTGRMELTYEREASPGVIETATRIELQPANPDHMGWNKRDLAREKVQLGQIAAIERQARQRMGARSFN